MFAKLYETDIGQILVKRDDGPNGPEVKVYFKPPGLGVCSVDFYWDQEDEDVAWAYAEERFNSITEDGAVSIVQVILDKM